MENILDVNISGPVSAYNFYIRDSAAANNLALIPASKKYGPQWSKMSENQKKKYEDLAEQDKQRYEEHMGLIKKFVINVDDLIEDSTVYSLFKRLYVAKQINEKDVKPIVARNNAKAAWEKLKDSEKAEFQKTFDES